MLAVPIKSQISGWPHLVLFRVEEPRLITHSEPPGYRARLGLGYQYRMSPEDLSTCGTTSETGLAPVLRLVLVWVEYRV